MTKASLDELNKDLTRLTFPKQTVFVKNRLISDITETVKLNNR